MTVALLLMASLVGKDWGVQRSTYADPVTGQTIHELPLESGSATNLYYHFSNFTADDQYVILASDRGGSWQIYRWEAATGRLVQLTDEPGVAAAAACVHRTDPRLIYYSRGPDVFEMDILDFRSRKLGSIPGLMGQATQTPGLKSLAFGRRRDQDNWEVVLFDLATGAWRTVVSVGFQIGHVQHSPTHPQIFYAWETGGYAPQRSWIVGDDGTANRPFYYRTDPKTWWTPLKEWMTHESWVSSSGRMTMIMDKVGIVVVEPGGASSLLVHGNYWHAAARPDGKFLVADDFDGRLWLIEAASGNTRLMMTGIRKTDRGVHAHASTGREGKYLLTNTSARGKKTVALLEVR